MRKLRPDLSVDSAGLRVAIPIAEEVREYLVKENADGFLKTVPESIVGKRLEEYDVIVAMEQRHKDAVLRLCSHCRADRVVVWGVADPYFMERDDAVRVYDEIKRKVEELAKTL
jgi:protein-tyrosine-phosphatase